MSFDSDPWIDWASGKPWMPAGAALIYAATVLHVPAGVVSVDARSVRRILVVWNVAMAAFSAWCAMVAIPHYLWGPNGAFAKGVVSSVCSDVKWYSTGRPGAMAVAFTMSKFVELGDTVFLVLRKKPLTYLHTFHHASTLMLTWKLFAYRASTGLVFIAMNAFIHAIMYSYYAGMLFPKIRIFIAPYSQWITSMQITQMAVGIVVNLVTAREIISGRICSVPPICVAAAGVLYSVYMIMFVQFALTKAVLKRK